MENITKEPDYINGVNEEEKYEHFAEIEQKMHDGELTNINELVW